MKEPAHKRTRQRPVRARKVSSQYGGSPEATGGPLGSAAVTELDTFLLSGPSQWFRRSIERSALDNVI